MAKREAESPDGLGPLQFSSVQYGHLSSPILIANSYHERAMVS